MGGSLWCVRTRDIVFCWVWKKLFIIITAHDIISMVKSLLFQNLQIFIIITRFFNFIFANHVVSLLYSILVFLVWVSHVNFLFQRFNQSTPFQAKIFGSPPNVGFNLRKKKEDRCTYFTVNPHHLQRQKKNNLIIFEDYSRF